jgi:hypothetical protein
MRGKGAKNGAAEWLRRLVPLDLDIDSRQSPNSTTVGRRRDGRLPVGDEPGARVATGLGYDAQLRNRVVGGGPDAVEAAIELMERHDPCSLGEAMALVLRGAEPLPRDPQIVAAAWDRYFHIRSMSWD